MANGPVLITIIAIATNKMIFIREGNPLIIFIDNIFHDSTYIDNQTFYENTSECSMTTTFVHNKHLLRKRYVNIMHYITYTMLTLNNNNSNIILPISF